jgi:HSP20 family protein
MANITTRRAPARASIFDRDMFGPSLARFFDFGNRMMESQPIGVMPAVEVSEADGEFVCTVELPGLTEKDVNVAIEGNTLTIKGEKREESESDKNGKRYHVWERTYGAFERAFSFPADVDAKKVTADFNNGVLTVRLPKTEIAKAGSRAIPIAKK